MSFLSRATPILLALLLFTSTGGPASAQTSPAASSPPAPPSPSQPPANSPPSPPQFTDVLFKNFKARGIGPAVMGGRVSDIAIDPRNPFVFYVGLGHGGVFK